METKLVLSVPTNQLPYLITKTHLLYRIFIVSNSHSVLLNIIPKKYPIQKESKAQGQINTKTGDTVLSAPFLIFSVFFTHVRKSWQQLRWRWDVWRWADPFEPTSSYGLQRGAYTRRRVMYYLGSVLPGRLIRAWLREAVTGCFSPSAQEWRRTRARHTDPDQYLHTLNVKRLESLSAFAVSCTGGVTGVFRRH